MRQKHLINIFIYDNSRTHRLKLNNIIRNYAEEKDIELTAVLSTTHLDEIFNRSFLKSWIYFLNIDDLEKKMDGIEFAARVRNHDLYGSIVFLTGHDIFADGHSDLARRSLKSHVVAMAFLSEDSAEFEKEIRECIAAHIRKI